MKIAGDTMEGPLEIKNVNPNHGEAKLKLNGKTGSTTNNCAHIQFVCQDNESKPGKLSYYSKGSSQKFKFDQDVELGSKDITKVDNIKFSRTNGVGIFWDDQVRIKFSSGGTSTASRVDIVSAAVDQHTFTIRGSTDNTDTKTERVLTVVHRRDTADDVYYNGRTSQNNNIMTRDATKKSFVQGGGYKITKSSGVYYIEDVEV